MTDREVMQQALEALEALTIYSDAQYSLYKRNAITALKAALEQPEQCKPLTATSILNMMPSSIPAEYDGPLMEFARAIEQALKERNT